MRIISLILLTTITHAATAQIARTEWSKNAVVYEVNVRQFSSEGTFSRVTEQLPRLKSLGVDILWLMPIHPIGEKNRKGSMGSYYSVKDYKAIDPSYGNETDFRLLVQAAHGMGMKVILDWVANHTAWDHRWITEHPEWYVRNEKGEIQTQYDWTDVAKLDYSNQEMRKAMIQEMNYWIHQFDIDGFRCDVAFLVPVDFWNDVRTELEQKKPVFMLAEMEWNTDITPNPSVYFTRAFDASYGWNFMGVTQDFAKGKKTLDDFRKEMKENYARFPSDMLKLLFITNHDENSWNGTVSEKYGKNWPLFAAMCYTLPQSLPLIYTGEEAGLNRRLSFFEKDPIQPHEWADTTRYGWYKKLTTLKQTNSALWNMSGATYTELTFTSQDTSIRQNVLGYRLQNNRNEVTVICNFSNSKMKLTPAGWNKTALHKTICNTSYVIRKNGEIELPAHSVIIFHQ
jgi:glycosidase